MKRHAVPKSWPVPRKGTTFVVKPAFGNEKGLPVLIILRDVLKIAQRRKEVKKALHEKNILLNGREVKQDKQTAVLGDVITIVPNKKSYRVGLKENGKFNVEEIADKDSGTKTSKIVDKKILKGKKTQLNLGDGRNLTCEDKCSVGDSVVIDLKNKKIAKILPMKDGASVLVFAGKHAGKKGKIEKLKLERKMASVKVGAEGEKINALIKQIMVVE